MTFEEAFYNFCREVEKQYGKSEGITQISLSPELYDAVIQDLFARNRMWRYSDINMSSVCGVSFRARTKESL